MKPNETIELRFSAGGEVTLEFLRRSARVLSALGPHDDPETADLWVGASAAATRRIVGLPHAASFTKQVNATEQTIAEGYTIVLPDEGSAVAVTFMAGSSDAQISVASMPATGGSYATAITYRLPNRTVRSNYEDVFRTLLDRADELGISGSGAVRTRLAL